MPAMVWQRSTQAARMAAQSTAMAGAVASNIRQAAVRTMYVVLAFVPAPREVRSRPYLELNKFCRNGIIANALIPTIES